MRLPSVEIPVPVGAGKVSLPDHDHVGVCEPDLGACVRLGLKELSSSTVVVDSIITVVLPGKSGPASEAEGASEIVAFGSGERPPEPPVTRPLVADAETSMTVVTDSMMV
jgi:hypothetical protein